MVIKQPRKWGLETCCNGQSLLIARLPQSHQVYRPWSLSCDKLRHRMMQMSGDQPWHDVHLKVRLWQTSCRNYHIITFNVINISLKFMSKIRAYIWVNHSTWAEMNFQSWHDKQILLMTCLKHDQMDRSTQGWYWFLMYEAQWLTE